MIERLETRSLLSAAPLSAADFTYLGAQPMPVAQTGWESGLTYRAATDTFFTIGNHGAAPFDLEEIKLPASGPATVIKDWGPIDPTGQLEASGSLLSMKGLMWDDSGKLWLSWGSYYNADHSNDECLAYVTLGGGKLHLHGPWGVPASAGSDNVRGEIALAPPELKAITGQEFISFAGKGSTSQDESWGPSLASFANPAQLPADSQTATEELTHWPMLHSTYAGPNGANVNDYYSAFPRMTGDTVTRIIGNDNVIPGVRPSYQFNTLATNSTFADGDGIIGGAWIKEPGIDGLIYFGRQAEGYSWYGNPDAHDDTSAAGVYYGNDLGVTDTTDLNRGSHAQAWNWTVDFVSATNVLATAAKVEAGTATASDLQQQPTSIVNLTSLGGNVPLPGATISSISGVYFDQHTGTLYILEQSGQMLEWHVGAPVKQAAMLADAPQVQPISTLVEAPAKSETPIPAAVDLVMSTEPTNEES